MIAITIPVDGPDADFASGCTQADEYEADASVDLESDRVEWLGGRVWRAGAVAPEALTVRQLELAVGPLAGWNTEAIEMAAARPAPAVAAFEEHSGTFSVVPVGTRRIEARLRRLGRNVA